MSDDEIKLLLDVAQTTDDQKIICAEGAVKSNIKNRLHESDFLRHSYELLKPYIDKVEREQHRKMNKKLKKILVERLTHGRSLFG